MNKLSDDIRLAVIEASESRSTVGSVKNKISSAKPIRQLYIISALLVNANKTIVHFLQKFPSVSKLPYCDRY